MKEHSIYKMKCFSRNNISDVSLMPQKARNKGSLQTRVEEILSNASVTQILWLDLVSLLLEQESVQLDLNFIASFNQCKDIIAFPAFLRKQCESKHSEISMKNFPKWTMAKWCLIVNLDAFITWIQGTVTVLGNSVLGVSISSSYHKVLWEDMNNK